MRIAVDALGGDRAPDINLDGVAAALASDADLSIALVGEAGALQPAIEARGDWPADRVTLHECEGCVGMDEKPTVALREKPNASITVCWRLLAAREVDAIVSAGNTGAVVASGLKTRLYLAGVKRPGIAVTLPTQRGACVLMDAGANPACKPEHLDQYARMAAVYVRNALGIERPRVGVVNIGGEIGKGNELVNETHKLLTARPLDGPRGVAAEYVGNVEGRELFEGAADVVVCDGFVGNVILKAAEGMAAMMLEQFARRVLPKFDVGPEGQAAIEQFAAGYRHNETGGAPLLGVDGLCLIAHGSSDGQSIANAIRMAGRLSAADLNSQLVEAIA